MKNSISYIALAITLPVLATGVDYAVAQTPTAPPPPGTVRAQGKEVDLSKDKKQPQDASPTAPDFDPRQQMRNFVRSISQYVRRGDRNFIVLTEGGLNLLEKVDPIDKSRRSDAKTYMRAIDGVIVKGLNFRPPDSAKMDFKTDDKVRKEMIRLADLGKKRGLRIWVSDFAENAEMVSEAFKKNRAKGYVPFAVANTDFAHDRIPPFPRRPYAENPRNITGLKMAKNYLYLTDSSAWDSQAKFVLAMSSTNFDALVVDVFHRGRRPFTKRNINGMKFKKLGAKRLVLAYMNIGEAESYRYYFKSGWQEGNPPFLGAPFADDPDKYHIRYWNSEWRKLMSGNTKSYAYGIVAQGFDGIVIGGVDAYLTFEKGK